MPASIPQSVRNAWGEEATEDFERWFDEAIQDRAVPRDEYRTASTRRSPVNSRGDEFLNRCEDLREDIRDVRDDLHTLRTRVNDQHFDRMNERMRVMTRWTVGTIALFGTLITVLIAVAEFVS
jgi:hypothetical protein